MARGSKTKYTDKQRREARHIEEGYESRGVSEDEATRRAWATVNKMTGGGRHGGSGEGDDGDRVALVGVLVDEVRIGVNGSAGGGDAGRVPDGEIA